MKCPECGALLTRFTFPLLTVDALIRDGNGRVLLIKRRNPPPGWALPGGFVDYGETVEDAVVREIHEETGLTLTDAVQFRAYSDPTRDPRHHIVTLVFSGKATGALAAGDDAVDGQFFPIDQLPEEMAADHGEIIRDYLRAMGEA